MKRNRAPQFDAARLRGEFPIIGHMGTGFAYLDNAATTQKPRAVLDALTHFYEHLNSNVHRGLYPLSERATEAYERARERIARFIGAPSPDAIVFTKSATEAMNLVAHAWGEENVTSGDDILVTILEHHSNFVPWQELARRKSARLVIVPCRPDGSLTADEVAEKITKRTRLVAVTGLSNALGSIVPVAGIVRAAHAGGARVLIDAAQLVAHLPTDVTALDCDWLAFSGHKMYGPTGIGVLYGKKELLDAMPPYLFGGGMIRTVTAQSASWADTPHKFEGGTPPIASAVALSAAADLMTSIGLENIVTHERALISYALETLRGVTGVRVHGPAGEGMRAGIIAFTVSRAHAHDIAALAGERGVCIRAGHHCAEPLHAALGVPATCRMSVGMYNAVEDIDLLADALTYAVRTLRI